MNVYEREARYLKLSRLQRGERQYTDTSNAERFLKREGGNIRYCSAWKKWLFWDGRRWCTDGNAEIQARAKDVVRDLYEEAKQFDYDWDREELANHAMKTEAVRRRKAMIEAATWEREAWVSPEDLDTDSWLLNCGNGTVDLRTGSMRPAERTDLITKLAQTDYVNDAQCPKWRRFVGEILGGNDGIVSFLQKAAGWALTGDMSEQILFILHGNGANGKSTFVNTLLNLLGDYGMATPTETFMKRSGRMSNDIARLRGRRLVTTIEADEGNRFSESLVKQITGNDRLTARFLYGEYFDFDPTFKIFIATNHKPVIRGTDHAIWRRIRLVPFSVTFPEKKQDKNLLAALKDEYPGILNWLIEGCLRWQTEGLGAPPAVREATEKYRTEMDVIGSFLRV